MTRNATHGQGKTYSGEVSTVNSSVSNGGAKPCEPDPIPAALADALAGLPDGEQPAIVEHLRTLATMNVKRRAAILALTATIDG